MTEGTNTREAVATLLAWMEQNRNERQREGMARFGIRNERAFGIAIPALRQAAKPWRGRHDVALALWNTGWHEARVLAGMIADPLRLTPEQMDDWTAAFDSWDVCDQCCGNLFWRVPFVREAVGRYAADGREYVRRTGFVLMAALAVHDRTVTAGEAAEWLRLIVRYAGDGRNFVRKAVNWALRQIGKRSMAFREMALETAQALAASEEKTARWIGRDAVRELTSEKTLALLRRPSPRLTGCGRLGHRRPFA